MPLQNSKDDATKTSNNTAVDYIKVSSSNCPLFCPLCAALLLVFDSAPCCVVSQLLLRRFQASKFVLLRDLLPHQTTAVNPENLLRKFSRLVFFGPVPSSDITEKK